MSAELSAESVVRTQLLRIFDTNGWRRLAEGFDGPVDELEAILHALLLVALIDGPEGGGNDV